MSEAKTSEPTSGGEPQSPKGSKANTGEGAKRTRHGPTKSVPVMVRITGSQAKRLDVVQAMEPALPTRAAAVRRLIDLLTDDDLATPLPTKTEGGGDPEYDKVIAALDRMTRALNERAKQYRAIGVQNNQLVKLGHLMRQGHVASGAIPEAAVQGIERALRDTLKEMQADDTLVAGVQQVVTSCRPAS